MTLGDLLRLTVESLRRLQIPYAVVGSFASGVWGEPRMTRDIDVVVQLGPQEIEDFCGVFSDDQFYLSRAAIEEAVSLHRPFNVIHPDSGNKVDFMVIGNSGWNGLQLSRRIEIELAEGITGYVAAPEDVILGKLTYYKDGGSDKHLRDIAGILKISDEIVDREYINRQARQLQVFDIWREILDTLRSS
ncbi:MAG: hypothetical protein GXP26_10000 [Planctomycetes bacterium]|nr:hypothetical protein [Planctomycetota bacterium]